MLEDKNVVADGPMVAINKDISDTLIHLTNTFGNLLVHVSGEGKIDFQQKESSSWLGMVKYIISGDIGCMKPYKGFDVSAFDQAIEYLLALENLPHLNSSINEEYVVSSEKWREFILGIKEDLSFVGSYKKKYFYELKGGDSGDVIVATISIEPLVNRFVVGEFNAAKNLEFLGELDDYDQPMIKSAVITINGEDMTIGLERLIHFRGRKYQPRKGDYLLYDKEKDYYVILPQEDYSIH